MRTLLTNPPLLPLIAPSILSADFARMEEECRTVLPAEGRVLKDLGTADLLHLDVMDGHFVPNLTMGPDMCRALRRALPTAFLDVHLMVTDPWPHAQAFAKAGANHVTFHVEVLPEGEIPATARRVRDLGLTVGLALNPPTPVEAVLPHVHYFDLVLVMSVNPGYSGQSFISDVLKKTEAVAEMVTPNQRVQMDGGIHERTVDACLDAGCDTVVAASAIFGVPPERRPDVIRRLRGRPKTETGRL